MSQRNARPPSGEAEQAASDAAEPPRKRMSPRRAAKDGARAERRRPPSGAEPQRRQRARAPAPAPEARSVFDDDLHVLELGGGVMLDVFINVEGKLTTFLSLDGQLLAELRVAGEA